ncbi:hypothetical protein N7455_004665 [Penicillium solitum]|uniref:uncharacterized protein n=1 Tax=Penicillium solitum TaxID=60172 RepID=UPI0032C45812|nr:hypothetical protein N7455_004665 [Penicillium solitum]
MTAGHPTEPPKSKLKGEVVIATPGIEITRSHDRANHIGGFANPDLTKGMDQYATMIHQVAH